MYGRYHFSTCSLAREAFFGASNRPLWGKGEGRVLPRKFARYSRMERTGRQDCWSLFRGLGIIWVLKGILDRALYYCSLIWGILGRSLSVDAAFGIHYMH